MIQNPHVSFLHTCQRSIFNSSPAYRFIWIILLAVFLGITTTSCDDTPGANTGTEASPAIRTLDLSPDSVRFNADEDRVTDTTITFTLAASVNTELPGNANPQFSVFNQDSLNQPIKTGAMESFNEASSEYEGSFQLKLRTTDIKNYLVYAYFFNENGRGNRAQHKLIVRGMAQNPPEILDTANPDTVVIPSNQDDIRNVRFMAEVVDPEGQDNIDRVFVDIVTPSGSLAGGEPFSMYDDGQPESGDSVAGDSVYTSTFSINANNNPQDYTLRYYAFDKTGLGSDTVRTSFILTN